jgi:outer membrane protein assembly factor BamD (BamD/ComL family)
MIARVLAIALSLSFAPLQCGHDPDPALRPDETPGDALWRLAHRFQDERDPVAARRTLEYLVERYPASRWAPAARDELSKPPFIVDASGD